MNSNTDNSIIVEPSRWDEVSPLVGGYPLRPYEELQKDPYYALPGFYAGERNARTEVLAFQPGWDGVDGEDAVHFGAGSEPTVAQVRERIASLLVSSWLVQDRDEPGFFPGEEPGSIVTPYGVIPADVIFAPRKSDDAPWENLAAVLADVDKALEAGAPSHGGYVDWRLKNTVPTGFRTDFSINPEGGFGARFTPRRDGYVVVFLWATDGRPRGGVREEYEQGGVVGLYEAVPVPGEEDLAPALLLYV